QKQLEEQQKLQMEKIAQAEHLAKRMEEALAQQGRLNRRLEKMAQDKVRMLRKLERIEETVIETRESLNAKALVLLTEKSRAAVTLDAEAGAPAAHARRGWARLAGREFLSLPRAAGAALVILALYGGWALVALREDVVT